MIRAGEGCWSGHLFILLGGRSARRAAVRAVLCTPDLNCARGSSGGVDRQPHSSLAAACAATITRRLPCRAQLRPPRVPAARNARRGRLDHRQVRLDQRLADRLPWASIHTFAAWQAWKYSSSVDSAGTSTRVVTPPGETPMAPAGSELGAVDGCADEDVVLPPCRHCRRRVSSRRPPTNMPAATSSPHSSRHRRGTMTAPAHSLNLCKTDGVMECFGFCECCRP